MATTDYEALVQRQVQGARRRVDELRRRAAAAGDSGTLLDEALEELAVALEEMEVTSEELRQQNETLAASQALLEEEHQRYLDLFRLAPDAYLVTDLDATIREANQEAVRLLGVRDRDLVGKPLAVFVDRGDVRRFREQLGRLPHERRVEGLELVLVPRGGGPVDVACTVEAERGLGGPAEGLRWLLRDVTAQKAAESAELRLAAERVGRATAEQARARLSAILENVSDGFVALDAGERLVYANSRAQELVRRVTGAEGPLEGRAAAELFPDAAAGEPGEALRRAAAGEAVRFEARIAELGAWVEVRAHPSGDGGVSVFFTDVGERRRAEEAARFLDDATLVLSWSLDYRSTLESLAHLAARNLADYCVVHVQEEGAVRAAGIAHQDPEKAGALRDLFRRHPVQPGDAHPVAQVMASGEPRLLAEVTPEVLAPLAGDEAHLEELLSLGLRSALVVPLVTRGRTLGTVSLGRTAGAAFGPADVELAAELARRAAIAVDNARLYQAAREAARSRDDMVAVVSHDLRNPLNAIMIAATVMEDYGDPARWEARDRRHLRVIRNSAERMSRLLQDLVEVAALERGGLTVSPAPLKPRDVAAAAAEMFLPIAGEKGVALEVDAPAGLPAVHADEARVLQVLGNLLGNAVRFTPSGGTVTLSAAATGRWVRFTVRDTGPGIPEEHRERLFDRYWRARSDPNSGAGLGLAIARAIVDAHGGEIWVESAAGEGSAFHFRLPVAEEEAEGSPES